jgi:hypothetical protein
MSWGIGLYKQHITKDGERWDNIAYQWYGDPFLIEPILATNSHVDIFPRLAGGQVLLIPLLPRAAVMPSIEGLPPWKL